MSNPQPFGPDLSSHNGPVSFPALRAGGADFAIIKKSQGKYYNNSGWLRDTLAARAAGLIVGNYHYLSYNFLPADQVPHYLHDLPQSPGHMPPIVDFENWSDSGEGGPVRSPEYMINWLHDFVFQLHSACGQWPIIYTYVYFWKTVLGNPSGYGNTCPLWIADYRKRTTPEVPGDWPYPTFWQYTATGTLPGVGGRVDISRFNGDLAGLHRLAGLGA